MMTPGVYSLAALSITTALSGQNQTAITGLEGMSGLSLDVQLSGTGGTSVTVIIQTTLDGTNWLDIACFVLTTAGRKIANLVAAALAIEAYAALSAEGVKSIFGNQIRASVSSVGTWVNGSLRVSAATR